MEQGIAVSTPTLQDFELVRKILADNGKKLNTTFDKYESNNAIRINQAHFGNSCSSGSVSFYEGYNFTILSMEQFINMYDKRPIAINVGTPMRSRLIQESLFAKGWEWISSEQRILITDKPSRYDHLFLTDLKNKKFGCGTKSNTNLYKYKVVTTEEFLENIMEYV